LQCFLFQRISANDNSGIIRTGLVIQNWKIDNFEDRIAEGTFPIEVVLPIREKINLQIIHSPAVSRYGDVELSGMSDTWIRGTYAVVDDKIMVSAGLGLPTGKTGLKNDEAMLSSLLSNNIFKFRLPVFGQGVTVSSGVMYVNPVNEKLAIGGGINFVYQGKYAYLDYDFDPGEQIGLSLGFDYKLSSSASFNIDLLYTYYMKDKLNDVEIFGAASKIGVKGGLIYGNQKRLLKVVGYLRIAGKNEIWDGTTLITEPKNSNITQMELEALYKMRLSNLFSLDILFDGRSYIENDYGLGQADIFGIGLGNNIQLTPNVEVNVLFKQFLGDGYFYTNLRSFSGIELQIGTTIRL